MTSVQRLQRDELSDLGTFATIAAEWDELVRHALTPTPYALHDYLAAWAAADGGGLAVVCVREGGRLVGGAAITTRRIGPFRIATFAGAPRVTPKDLLIHRDAPSETAALVVAGIRKQRFDWFSAYGLQLDGALVGAAGGDLRLVRRGTRHLLDLSAGFDATCRTAMGSKNVAESRRKLRRLEDDGAELVRCCDPVEVAAGMDALFAAHALRWQNGGDHSVLSTAHGRETVRDAMLGAARAGTARVHVLRKGEQTIAVSTNLLIGGTLFGYRNAFDPAYARSSPGMLVTLAALRDAIDEGARSLDLGDGGGDWKVRFSDEGTGLYEGIGLSTRPHGAVGASLHCVVRKTVDRRRHRAAKRPSLGARTR